MPDRGERPAVENERRLETASCRDPPTNDYGAQLLERALPPQQQQQQQSGGRKKTGGIMSRENYKGKPVEIRVPRWTDNKLWINSEDFEAAQYNADAAFHYTGRSPVHFPNVKFKYLPLRLSTGEELTTREKCSAYVAKIAKGPALRGQRRDFKERTQKLILEMVNGPEIVQFLNIVRASPRQPCQPRPEANPGNTYSPFIDDENWTDVEAGTPSEEAIQSLPSTVTVNPSQCGSVVPVAQDTHSARADDSEEENMTPMEVDSVSEEAIQALAQTVAMDPTAVFQVGSTVTSYYVDVDWATAYIPSFGMDSFEPQNSLTSVGQSLGIGHPRFGEKEKEYLVPDNCKDLLVSLDKGEEEAYQSTEPSDWELWSPHPPFVPNSPLWVAMKRGSYHDLSRSTIEQVDVRAGITHPNICKPLHQIFRTGTVPATEPMKHDLRSIIDSRLEGLPEGSTPFTYPEALRPSVRPILCQNRWRP